jgi:hypothetical protein
MGVFQQPADKPSVPLTSRQREEKGVSDEDFIFAHFNHHRFTLECLIDLEE